MIYNSSTFEVEGDYYIIMKSRPHYKEIEILLKRLLLRWIISTRISRMASTNSFESFPTSFNDSIFLNRLDCIMGASRFKTADITKKRADCILVNTNKEYEDHFHHKSTEMRKDDYNSIIVFLLSNKGEFYSLLFGIN